MLPSAGQASTNRLAVLVCVWLSAGDDNGFDAIYEPKGSLHRFGEVDSRPLGIVPRRRNHSGSARTGRHLGSTDCGTDGNDLYRMDVVVWRGGRAHRNLLGTAGTGIHLVVAV